MRLSMCYRRSRAADHSGLSLASAPCRMPLPSTDVDRRHADLWAIDPLVGAVREDLTLPNRKPMLDLVDQTGADIERLAAMRGADSSYECHIAYRKPPDAVADRQRLDLGFTGIFVG